MKTKSWAKFSTAFAFSLLWTSCSNDWGQVDPPAGIDYAPTLEKVCEYTFDDEGGLDASVFTVVPYPDGSMPALIDDDMVESKVLDLTGGYAKIKNPLKSYAVQKGASMTFWMKQVCDPLIDEEGNQVEGKYETQDVTTPLLHWENLNGTCTFDFSTNGWINYDGADGKISLNDPSEYKTGYITPNEWHYVALVVRNDGYGIYVDGMKKAEVATEKSLASAVQLIAQAENMYVNYGASTHSKYLVDDLKVYRNLLTDKEIARPTKGKIGKDDTGDTGLDYGTFEYCLEGFKSEVGSPDCSTGWWTEFSNYYRIPAETSMHIGLTNHTSGGGNWNNWNLCVCTDDERGGANYKEYFVIRSDLYGWGESYNGDNWTNTGYGDWDQFRLDMEGAKVDIDIVRQGAEITVTATAVALNGTVYTESIHATCGEGDQVVRAFLICDGSYLELAKEEIYAYWPVTVNTSAIGAPDCSTGWWTEFSDYFPIPSNLGLHLGLTNHTSGGGNWNNWNLCVCTDDERGGANYVEYFVIRSDLYGWGANYNGDNWTNTGYGDWDQFRQDMEGADVDITVERNNADIKARGRSAALNGNVYDETITAIDCGSPSDPIRAFLICDGSYLEMQSDDCYLYKAVFK